MKTTVIDRTIIRHIHEHAGEHILISDFENRYAISRGAASKHVNALIKEGYITRNSKKYKLTELGVNELNKMNTVNDDG